jgi:protein TonB
MDSPAFPVFPATPASPAAAGPLDLRPGVAPAAASRSSYRPFNRNAAIAIAVVALHVGFVWALQSGLLIRAVELIVPVEILTEFVTPPAPKAEPIPPATPTTPAPPVATKKKPAEKIAEVPVKTPPRAPTPQPLAVPDTAAATAAPAAAATPAPAAAAAPAAATVAAAGASGPPSVQMPSSDADYLQNPQPSYPALSRRMNEQGKSVIKVLIDADGLPQKAEIARSSGFDRLDQAALTAVMRWRFLPGKRNGVAQAMWFDVPINWELRN